MSEGGPNFEKKEKPKDRLIVEVGSGSLPIFVDLPPEYRARFDNDPSAQYVGVDVNPHELTFGKKLQQNVDLTKGYPVSEKIHYVTAAAEALPFADNSVSELFLRNVLGDPDIDVETKHEAIQEAARVLKKGALLKIVEVYTPLMVHEDDLFRYIDEMPGKPFIEWTDEEIAALPDSEKEADHALKKDLAAADTLKLGASFVLRYKRA